jgi:hypothetical protein
MAFLEYDPRQLNCYEKLKEPAVDIPTTDNVAWAYFKEDCWVYNKLQVVLSQNVPGGPIGVTPSKYPIVIKPIYNMFGGGIEARKINNSTELEKYYHPGCMWMTWVDGIHYSHDIMVVKGLPVWAVSFKGHSIGKGMFDYWEVETPSDLIMHYICNWIEARLPNYTGCVCLETITDITPVIIEVHLRMGDIDRLGNYNLMNSIIGLYENQVWEFKDQIDKFYLFAIWGESGVKYKICLKKVKELCKNLVSYQIDRPELYYQNPIGGIRLAILNGYDKKECIRVRNEMIPYFSPQIPDYLRKKITSSNTTC